MSILPPTFRSVVMPLTRAGDPDPYAITWAYDGAGSEFTSPQAEVNAIQANFVVHWASSLPNDCVIGPAVLRVGQDGGDPLIAYASSTASGSVPPSSLRRTWRSSSRSGRSSAGGGTGAGATSRA